MRVDRNAFWGAFAGLVLGAALVVSVLPAGAGVGDPLALGAVNSIDERTDLKGSAKGANLQIKNTGNAGALTAKASKNVLKAKATSGPVAINANASRNAIKIKVDAGQSPMKVNASAGTATNLSADLLDGKDASELDVDRVDGFDSTYLAPRATYAGPAVQGTICSTSDCGATVLSATIDAPGPGLILLAGTLDLERYTDSDDNVTCGVRVDGAYPVGGAVQLNLSAAGDDPDADDQEENCTVTAWRIVDPGTHTVDMRVYSVRDTETKIGGPYGGNLWAMWVPVDGGTGDWFD